MAWARWSDTCDVYIYDDIRGDIVVHVTDGTTEYFYKEEDVIEYLHELKAAGKKIPDYLFNMNEEDEG